jgi:hypothetical protein
MCKSANLGEIIFLAARVNFENMCLFGLPPLYIRGGPSASEFERLAKSDGEEGSEDGRDLGKLWNPKRNIGE